MGIGPIPFAAMTNYASANGIDEPDRFDRFRAIVSAADSEYLRLNQPKKDSDAVADG